MKKLYVALEHIDMTADFSARQALITLLNLKAAIRYDEHGERCQTHRLSARDGCIPRKA